jgi:hypothetical protein
MRRSEPGTSNPRGRRRNRPPAARVDARLITWWITRCLNLAGVRRPPVDIGRVVAAAFPPGRIESVQIRPATLEPGIVGKCCVSRGEKGLKAIIHYDECFEVPRIRYVVAHEMWHLFRAFSPSRRKESLPSNAGKKPALEEAEADYFARHLLMPERFMRGEIERYKKCRPGGKISGGADSVSPRLRNLAFLHELAGRFVVTVSTAEARMKEFLGWRWRAVSLPPALPSESNGAKRRGTGDTYRIRLVDHRGEAAVMRGISARDLRSRIEMTVTWSGTGPKKGRPPRHALPAVVAISNERKKSDRWYYEGVGMAGVLDLRGKWGKILEKDGRASR